MQVLIVVTHLLGTGHLKRCINLAQAFAAAGHTVTLASGGYPVSQFNTDAVSVVQLPPLASDGTNFKRLLTPDGSVANEAYLASRKDALCELVQTHRPALLITELFPFGRRILRDEFIALLQTARALPTPAITLASVRDILSPPSSEKKVRATEEIIHTYYEGVLVHSNEHSTPLEKSWPVSAELSDKLMYTGYVAPGLQVNRGSSVGHDEIVVSAGGGAVGRHVFETAIEAACLTDNTKWRLLVGGLEAAAEVIRLQQLDVASSVLIETAREDFRELLCHAACSVSLCGYNTAVDLLQTGTPAVLIPFDEGGETEQVLRAESLSTMPSFELLLAKDLSAQSLVDSIAKARQAGRVEHSELQFDGAAEAVRIAVKLVR